MGLFNRKEEKEQVIQQDANIKQEIEINKIKESLRDFHGPNGTLGGGTDTNTIINYYKNGASYSDIMEIISLLNKYNIEETKTIINLLEIKSIFNDKILANRVINYIIENYKYDMDRKINYIISSRTYYTDEKTWYSRLYDVLISNNDYNLEQALLEDQMRIGIYPNVSKDFIESQHISIENIKSSISSLSKELDSNIKKIENIKTDVDKTSKETTDSIKNVFNKTLTELDEKKLDILKSINIALDLNPSSKKDVLKEVQKQYDVVYGLDDSIDIKERYEKLISNKDKNIIYNPVFDDVLKYILSGNTICLDGPKKCGKTELVKQLANLLNLPFSNLGNIYDEISQINGYYDFNTNYNKPTFQKNFENGGITLIKNINKAPIQAIDNLNNIIGNFKYNPYIFGDKLLTTPSKNFKLIMTTNSQSISNIDIDNLVTVKMDYDTKFESSLTDNKELISFLHNLRKQNILVTTSTFIDVINHLKLGLFNEEKVIEDYIVKKNSTEQLKKNTDTDNKYGKVLSKVLTK